MSSAFPNDSLQTASRNVEDSLARNRMREDGGCGIREEVKKKKFVKIVVHAL